MPSPADLRARLGELSSLDQARFQRRIGGAAKVADSARRSAILDRLDGEISEAAGRYARRSANAPRQISYPDELPISERREELLEAIRDHQVVIVAGETGSGKSTQLPKLCLELGRGIEGLIAHTQPRRLAARTIAERVAEELDTTVGGKVGFAVRFTDRVGEGTLVKLMTDGLLLAEIQRDRRLSSYDTIIVDEAHERSLNVDFLLGYLHRLLPQRPDLKVIITSATIDTERFAQHFHGAPVIEVSGRTYPVEVRYQPLDDPGRADVQDQPAGIASAVEQLFGETSGDILVFCAGEREIRDAADAIAALELRHVEVVPLFARLSAAEQHRVFHPARGRRVVVATNIAETSLTVPGVRSVVDAGTARISRYSRRTKVQRLPIEPVSQASANQRAGRCGRLGPGVCIRLYSEDDFESRPAFTEPEIQRTSLASVILQMANLGLGDIAAYPFIDPPDLRSIRDGVLLLEELHAVERGREGTREWLTDAGRKLARLPVDPRFGRMIFEAHETDCLREVLIIASALSVRDPRERPADREQAADTSHARFTVDGSDLLGWLTLWDHLSSEQAARSGNQFRRMCRSEFLNYLRVREWQGVHAQLVRAADELDLRRNRKPADPDSVHRAVLAGLLSHVGNRNPNGFEYRGARGARFAIQPGSALFKTAPEWVMAAELVETSRLWARGLAAIDPDWLERAGAHLISRTYSDPWWDSERGVAVASETVTLYGLTIVAGRTIQFDRVDAGQAREMFIRHALVEGEWDTHHEFVAHNRRQFADVGALESRGRVGDVMVDDDELVAFFAERIPDEIVSVRHFDRWWRDQRHETPDLLNLQAEQLIDPEMAPVDDEAFPETLVIGDLELPLTYVFDPASPEDGVTVHVPVTALDRLDPALFDWLVPGLRRDLVTGLIRSLPKRLRKVFLPVPETVEEVLPKLDTSSGPVLEVLRRELTRISGERLLPSDFAYDDLASHLRPRFSIVTADGAELASGPDLDVLKQGLQSQAKTIVDDASHPLEREGITAWDFGELPDTVVIEGEGAPLTVYPALVDHGDSVAIRLLATRDEQHSAMWAASRRLLTIAVGKAGPPRPLLSNDANLALVSSPHDSVAAWEEDCRQAALDDLMAEAGGAAWDAVAFDELLSAVRFGLVDRLAEVRASSIEALQHVREARAKLEQLKTGHEAAVSDMSVQLDRLIYPGFVSGLGAERIPDLSRWVRAISRRADRLRDNPDRDAVAMVQVQSLEEEHDHLVDVLGWTQELIEIAWQLQELRVSLFAQSVGAKGSVSVKRVKAQLEGAAL